MFISPILKLAKFIKRTMFGRHPSSRAIEIVIDKGIPRCAFLQLSQSLQQVLEKYPCRVDSAINQQFEKQASELKGQIRTTTYRHNLVTMDAAEVFRQVSSPTLARALLYHTVRTLTPSRCVELGSAFGIAGMVMAYALSDNQKGTLSGIEYEPWRAEIAQHNIRLALSEGVVVAGKIEDCLPELVEAGGRFDFAFVDAEHTAEACMRYHHLLCNSLAADGIVVWDDIDWSQGMKQFWQMLLARPEVRTAMRINGRWGITEYHLGEVWTSQD